MISHAFHHSGGAGIADTESLSRNAVYKRLAAGRSVQGHISDYDIVLSLKLHPLGRVHHQLAAGKPLSKVVIGIPHQFQGKSLGYECPKALSAASAAVDGKGIFRQTLRILSGDLRTKNGSQGTVYIGHIHLYTLFLAAV